MTKYNKLTGQNWQDWSKMAEGTLAGASQMVWQNKDEFDEQRSLFARVTGDAAMRDYEWRNAITWVGATLLSLSAEQSMKALSVKASANGECCKTHDLMVLWNELSMEDKKGIEKAAKYLQEHNRGTKLAMGDSLVGIEKIERIIDHHRDTFERSRYYREVRENNEANTLTKNIELWKFALAALTHAKEPDSVY